MMPASDALDLFPIDKIISAPNSPARLPSPWHKPRKHWVRKEQWGKLVDNLIDDINFDGRPFRYLTLPGDDLLDIRHIYRVCDKKKISLKYLGFNSSRDNIAVNVSVDEVRHLVHPDSHLEPDRLESIANKKAIGHERMKEFTDFDAINIDLCSSVASKEAGANDTVLAAILQIIEHQNNHRTAPWLLFITTHCDRESVKKSVLHKVLTILKSNLDTSVGFKKKSEANTLLDIKQIEKELAGSKSILESEFLSVFGIGFSKWLLKLTHSVWKMKQEISVCYRTKGEKHPNMLSLAIRFDKQPSLVNDNSGLTAPKKQPLPKKLSEEELAISLLNSFIKLADIDQILFKDPGLKSTIINENADFLAQARFDPAEMRKWGEENCWSPTQ